MLAKTTFFVSADYFIAISAHQVPYNLTTETGQIDLMATDIALTNLTNANKGYFRNETMFNATEVSESNKKIHNWILFIILVLVLDCADCGTTVHFGKN